MEKHYNFENGVKGKFYIPENEIQLPVYLDFDLQKTLLKLANEKNKSYSDLVGDLLIDDLKNNYPNSNNIQL